MEGNIIADDLKTNINILFRNENIVYPIIVLIMLFDNIALTNIYLL